VRGGRRAINTGGVYHVLEVASSDNPRLSPLSAPTVPTARRTGLLAASVLAALLSATSLAAQAMPTRPTAPPVQKEGAHHHHMPGLPPATIPAGALYTEADVHFMQGMIAHHGQAIHMSRLATARGAHPRLLRLAQKIDQSQAGEIVLMQEWLRANGQFAPADTSWRTIFMPGMLTAEELARLEGARGTDFDRQYLLLMIRHHEGALQMVADLLATPRAAQDVDVSVFANDVEIVQAAEIALMRQLLQDL